MRFALSFLKLALYHYLISLPYIFDLSLTTQIEEFAFSINAAARLRRNEYSMSSQQNNGARICSEIFCLFSHCKRLER